MRTPFVLIVLVAAFVFTQCSKDKECGACFTPPAPFVFEVVDKTTGENLFANGTYNPDDLEITNAADQAIEFSFINENDLNLIQISSIGWQTEKVELSVSAGNEQIFNLSVDAERLSENCCSFTRYHDVKIEDATFELNTSTGIYKILKD